MIIITRPFNKEIDANFILGGWSNGAYFGSKHKTKLRRDQFYKMISEEIKKKMHSSKILIACTQEDPKHLLGFCVIDGTKLEWIYVKEAFRQNKVGSLLLKNQNIDSYDHQYLTRFANKFLEAHPDYFNKPKENEDGTSGKTEENN